jgi:hypothetical protein
VAVSNQLAAAAGAALQACPCVVVVADLPAMADGAQQDLCAALAALAARGTTIIFAANAAPLAGHRPGLVTAALLPDTIVATGLAQTPDPVTHPEVEGVRRWLVLEGTSYVAVSLPHRTIAVHGNGCVLVITLPAAGGDEPTRLTADVLTAGMAQAW